MALIKLYIIGVGEKFQQGLLYPLRAFTDYNLALNYAVEAAYMYMEHAFPRESIKQSFERAYSQRVFNPGEWVSYYRCDKTFQYKYVVMLSVDYDTSELL